MTLELSHPSGQAYSRDVRPIVSGFVVVRADHSEERVPEGRAYSVADDGELVFKAGDRVVAAFAPGAWSTVRQVGLPLRETWPPPDFDYLIDNLLDALIVRQGWGVYAFQRERFLDPLANDFEVFVDWILEADGERPPHFDSDQRRFVCALVARTFGVENRQPTRQHRSG